MIKYLYSKLRKAMMRANWAMHSASLSVSDGALATPPQGMSLVLAPHADDELIGCHVYMQRSQCTGFCCSLTGSDPSEENRTVRNGEFAAYCSANSIACVIAEVDVKRALLDCLQRVEPDTILLPAVVDWHPEHRLVNEIVLELTKQLQITPRIIWYQVSIPIPGERVNLALPMTDKEYSRKWDAFYRFYVSQARINVERFQYVENRRMRAYRAAECFHVLGYDLWEQAVNRAKAVENEIEAMKHTINDFAVTERAAKELYDYVLGE